MVKARAHQIDTGSPTRRPSGWHWPNATTKEPSVSLRKPAKRHHIQKSMLTMALPTNGQPMVIAPLILSTELATATTQAFAMLSTAMVLRHLHSYRLVTGFTAYPPLKNSICIATAMPRPLHHCPTSLCPMDLLVVNTAIRLDGPPQYTIKMLSRLLFMSASRTTMLSTTEWFKT